MKNKSCAFIVLVAALSVVLIPVDISAQCIIDCPQGPGGVSDTGVPQTHRTPDMTFDGIVGIADFTLFAFAYCVPANYDPCADFNCDGLVDLIDLMLFSRHFGPPGHAGISPVACDP